MSPRLFPAAKVEPAVKKKKAAAGVFFVGWIVFRSLVSTM